MYRVHADLTVSDGDDFTYRRALPTRATFLCDYATFSMCIGDPEPCGFIVPVATPSGPIVIWRESAAAATPIWHAKVATNGPLLWLFARLPEGLEGWARAEGSNGAATLKGYVLALAEYLEVRATALVAGGPLAEDTAAVARALRLLLEATDLRGELWHVRAQLLADERGTESVRAARSDLVGVLGQLLDSSVPSIGPVWP